MAGLRTTNGSTIAFLFQPGSVLRDRGEVDSRHTVGPAGASVPNHVADWALAKYGTRMERTGELELEEEFPCLIEGCGKTFTSQRGLSMHITIGHNGNGENGDGENGDNPNGNEDDAGLQDGDAVATVTEN